MTVLVADPVDIELDYLDHPYDPDFLYFIKGGLCLHLGRNTDEIYLESENLIITDCTGMGPFNQSSKCIFRANTTMIDMILKLHRIRRQVTMEARYDPERQRLLCHIQGDRKYQDHYLFLRDLDCEPITCQLMELRVLKVDLNCQEDTPSPWVEALHSSLSRRFLVHSAESCTHIYS